MNIFKSKIIDIMCIGTALLSIFALLGSCNPVVQENTASQDVSKTLVPCDMPICKNWELVTNITIEDTLSVQKFRSKRTGMVIVLAPAESPIVNGYFCLSTEAFNDAGLPPTSEHLISLGR